MESEDILARLPEALHTISSPRFFGPSRIASLIRCPLSEIHGSPEEDQLIPSPLAILGSVVHTVMQQATDSEILRHGDDEMSVESLFQSEIRRVEGLLSSSVRTQRLVPLSTAVGKTEYHIRKTRLRTWARESIGKQGHHPPVDAHCGLRVGRSVSAGGHTEDTVRIPIGSERPLRVSSLRLSGRPDLIRRDREGTFHVTDFKTGSVTNRTGDIKEDYALQLRLYGLMLQMIDPGAEVKLWVEGTQKLEVAWDRFHMEQTMETLRSVSERLPVGEKLSATDIAEEGSHCGNCRIRHICPRYRSVAPVWWKNESSTAPVGPSDIWGKVKRVLCNGETITEVTLLDAAGRLARVSGLKARGVAPDDRVWLFGLQPTETVPHHGSFVHPRNFHVRSPSRIWRDALRFQGFADAQTDTSP